MGFIGTPLQVLCDQAPSHNGIRGATALTEIDTTKSRFLFESRTRRPTPQTQRPQTLLGLRPLSRSSKEPLSVTSWESQVTPGFVAPTPSCFFSRSTDFFVRPFVVLALSFWRLSNRVAAVARIVVLSLPPPTVQVIALFSSHPRKTRYAFHRVFWELCTATGRAWLTRPVLADAVTFLVGFGRGHVRGLGRVGAA